MWARHASRSEPAPGYVDLVVGEGRRRHVLHRFALLYQRGIPPVPGSRERDVARPLGVRNSARGHDLLQPLDRPRTRHESQCVGGPNQMVWRPDAFGSVCFLVASELAFYAVGTRWFSWRPRLTTWWIAMLNLVGSVAFGVSAVASFVIVDSGCSATRSARISGRSWARCAPRRGVSAPARADPRTAAGGSLGSVTTACLLPRTIPSFTFFAFLHVVDVLLVGELAVAGVLQDGHARELVRLGSTVDVSGDG